MAAERIGQSSIAEGTRASMGPRPDGRGTPVFSIKGPRTGASFNGAAAGWPRNVWTPAPKARPSARLQWGRGRMAAERCKLRSCRAQRPASMGPRPDGRGTVVVREPVRGAEDASMGPRPDGRGTEYDSYFALCGQCASMGPRPDGRGTSTPQAQVLALHRLQWGRGRMAAERADACREAGVDSELQWGRGRMAAERRRPSSPPPSLPCFNGAAAGWPRNGSEVVPSASSRASFNGAAAGWPRND